MFWRLEMETLSARSLSVLLYAILSPLHKCRVSVLHRNQLMARLSDYHKKAYFSVFSGKKNLKYEAKRRYNPK